MNKIILRPVQVANKNGSLRITLPASIVKGLELNKDSIIMFNLDMETHKVVFEKWQPEEEEIEQ